MHADVSAAFAGTHAAGQHLSHGLRVNRFAEYRPAADFRHVRRFFPYQDAVCDNGSIPDGRPERKSECLHLLFQVRPYFACIEPCLVFGPRPDAAFFRNELECVLAVKDGISFYARAERKEFVKLFLAKPGCNAFFHRFGHDNFNCPPAAYDTS